MSAHKAGQVIFPKGAIQFTGLQSLNQVLGAAEGVVIPNLGQVSGSEADHLKAAIRQGKGLAGGIDCLSAGLTFWETQSVPQQGQAKGFVHREKVQPCGQQATQCLSGRWIGGTQGKASVFTAMGKARVGHQCPSRAGMYDPALPPAHGFR